MIIEFIYYFAPLVITLIIGFVVNRFYKVTKKKNNSLSQSFFGILSLLELFLYLPLVSMIVDGDIPYLKWYFLVISMVIMVYTYWFTIFGELEFKRKIRDDER